MRDPRTAATRQGGFTFLTFAAGLRLVALLGAVGLATACAPAKHIEIDPRFSINLVRVPSWFPDEKDPLKPAEKAVIERYGRPEFIRFWWNEDGAIVTSSDFSGQQAEVPTKLAAARRSWLYPSADMEIEFAEAGGYYERPLSDKFKLLCRYGDPSSKSPLKTDSAGQTRETWRWIDNGLQIEFVDDLEVKRTRFTSTGAGTDLLK